jgi:hypothetical protein
MASSPWYSTQGRRHGFLATFCYLPLGAITTFRPRGSDALLKMHPEEEREGADEDAGDGVEGEQFCNV